MRVVAVVQARMGSTRLPGKVLHDLAGAPMLARIIERLRRCESIDDVLVATSDEPGDRAIAVAAKRLGADCFRGSHHDVLSRYVGAARVSGADVVVRVTADCPLIDPEVTSSVVEGLLASPAVDYAANVLRRSFPRGLDVEAMHVDVLHRLDRLAVTRRHREHVTLFIRERSELFRCRSVVGAEDNSDLRWTVDTAEDYAMISELYEQLGLATRELGYADLVRAVRARPALSAINAGIAQAAV